MVVVNGGHIGDMEIAGANGTGSGDPPVIEGVIVLTARRRDETTRGPTIGTNVGIGAEGAFGTNGTAAFGGGKSAATYG